MSRSRIKLPGSLRTKKIILSLLVVCAVGALIYEGIENKTLKDKRLKEIEEQKLQDELLEEELNKIQLENDKNNEREEFLYEEARNLFYNEGNYEKTIEKANEIIIEFPNSYKAYSIRGIAKAYNGSFEEGMNDIDKALEINPNFGYARFNKALSYELYWQLDNALEWYNKALEVEEYVWSYYGIASIYGRNGDVENTVKYLSKAIDMEAAVKEEAKNEADFDNVRQSEEFQKLIQ